MSLSALMAYQRRLGVQNQHVLDGPAVVSNNDDDILCKVSASVSSSYAASTPLSSLSASISSADTSSTNYHPLSIRRNEHLAVLIPKHLWKQDSQAAHCDIFHCRKPFSLFERRHHCRKCGGVFCGKCSAYSIPLLDTSNLEFFHPPRNVPLSTFESPSSPIAAARVCVECWDQVNGFQTPRTPDLLSSPIPCAPQLLSSNSSPVATPPDALPLSRPIIRRSQTLPDFPQIPPPPPSPTLESEDLGELATYPLRYASAVCKKTGGGRWRPKKVTTIDGYRIPGCKAQFEIDMEQEEAEWRRLKSNPVFKDGDFQYRVPREVEPQSLRGVGPLVLSTF